MIRKTLPSNFPSKKFYLVNLKFARIFDGAITEVRKEKKVRKRIS